MIKIKTNLINIYNKYVNINKNEKQIKVLKKGIKLFTNIIYITILYLYMPETFVNNSNLDDKDKMLFMACFIIFSGVMSYVLQNYQWKPPGSSSDTDIAYNIDINNIEATGWKRTLIRIFLAIR